MSLASQYQNWSSESGPRLELCRLGEADLSFQSGAGGLAQKGNISVEEDEIRGIQKWIGIFRDVLVPVYTMFPICSSLWTLSSK